MKNKLSRLISIILIISIFLNCQFVYASSLINPLQYIKSHFSDEVRLEDDYYTAKHINVDGEVLAGLVTELDFPDHPEYWTMDFDQLWDVFVKNYSRDDLTKKTLDDNSEEDNKLSDDYVEGYNRLVDDYNAGKITKEQISRWLNAQGK